MRRREIERELQIDERRDPRRRGVRSRRRGRRALRRRRPAANRPAAAASRRPRSRFISSTISGWLRQRLVEILDRSSAPRPCRRCATDSGRRPRPCAAPSGRACRRARSACRRPCGCWRRSRIRPACRSLKIAVPIRAGEVVDARRSRARASPRAVARPCGEQRRRQIGDRAAHRLREILPRQRILLLLERPHAEHEPRDAVGVIDLEQRSASLPASSMSPSVRTERKVRLRDRTLRGSLLSTLR